MSVTTGRCMKGDIRKPSLTAEILLVRVIPTLSKSCRDSIVVTYPFPAVLSRCFV